MRLRSWGEKSTRLEWRGQTKRGMRWDCRGGDFFVLKTIVPTFTFKDKDQGISPPERPAELLRYIKTRLWYS